MGFLNSDTITVDAILTDTGRSILADGSALFPGDNVNFALSDDGIDYSLWNVDHPSGSDSYDDAITNMPQIEASPLSGTQMRYKLVTLANRDVIYIPFIIELPDIVITRAGMEYKELVSPRTDNGRDNRYIFQFSNVAPISVTHGPGGGGVSGTNNEGITGGEIRLDSTGILTPYTIIGKSIYIAALSTDHKIRGECFVTGEQSGAVGFFTYTINRNIAVPVYESNR